MHQYERNHFLLYLLRVGLVLIDAMFDPVVSNPNLIQSWINCWVTLLLPIFNSNLMKSMEEKWLFTDFVKGHKPNM